MTRTVFHQLTRRQFLNAMWTLSGASALSSCASWIPTSLARIDHAESQASDPLRFAVVGTGTRGTALIQHLLAQPGVAVTAICDDYPPNLSKAAQLLTKHSNAYTDYATMLSSETLDAVIVATPLHEHAGMTIEALRQGMDVYCEKAMARNVMDCLSMIHECAINRQILYIGHQRMFGPGFLEAILRIREGTIGDVTQVNAYWRRNSDWRKPVPDGSDLERKINWRLYKQYSAGLMSELASHQIQIANWVFDTHPIRVCGSGSLTYWRDGRDIYDHVALVYDYPNGRRLVYDSMANNRKYGSEEIILGSKGNIEAERQLLFPEVDPDSEAIDQLVDNLQNWKVEDIPIGGPSWRPELGINTVGTPLTDRGYDGTAYALEAFAASVRDRHQDLNLLREGYFASIAALLGEQAMDRQEIIQWPDALNFPSHLFEE